MSVREQIKNIKRNKNLSSAERFLEAIKDEYNPFKQINFNIDDVSNSKAKDLDEHRYFY